MTAVYYVYEWSESKGGRISSCNGHEFRIVRGDDVPPPQHSLTQGCVYEDGSDECCYAGIDGNCECGYEGIRSELAINVPDDYSNREIFEKLLSEEIKKVGDRDKVSFAYEIRKTLDRIHQPRYVSLPVG